MMLRTVPAIAAMLLAAALQLACQSLLPHGRTQSKSPWNSFAEARSAFDRIEPGQTRIGDLVELGMHPFESENVAVLTYVDVFQRFVPNGGILLDQQAHGVQQCVAARERCTGLVLEPFLEQDREFGSFWLNFFEFRTQTEMTGWVFAATLVLVDDVVVYKLWDGNPSVRKGQDSVKPLGFLQDVEVQFQLTFP